MWCRARSFSCIAPNVRWAHRVASAIASRPLASAHACAHAAPVTLAMNDVTALCCTLVCMVVAVLKTSVVLKPYRVHPPLGPPPPIVPPSPRMAKLVSCGLLTVRDVLHAMGMGTPDSSWRAANASSHATYRKQSRSRMQSWTASSRAACSTPWLRNCHRKLIREVAFSMQLDASVLRRSRASPRSRMKQTWARLRCCCLPHCGHRHLCDG